MCKSLNHTLDCLLGSVGITRDLVAHLHDGAPVLGGEVLVGRLGCVEKNVLAKAIVFLENIHSYIQRSCEAYRRHRQTARPLVLGTWLESFGGWV